MIIKTRVGIIGGAGAMGKWFARLLLAESMEIILSGRSQEKLRLVGNELGVPITTNIEVVKQSDVVIISVPPDTFETVVEEIAPFTRKNQIIVDVTSIKTAPVEVMHRYIKNGIILGTHPVFGPGAKNLSNHNIVLTPVNDEELKLAEKVKTWLETKGAHISIMSPREHDSIMTVVLGLAHFIAIVAADTLLSFDNFAEMKKIGGTTFKVLYTLVESVVSEDPQLYASLQMSFPDIGKVESLFLDNTKLWAEMVKVQDAAGFSQRMNALREKLEKTDPAFRKAYENMYKITERL